MGTRHLGGLALGAAASFIMVVAGHAGAQVVTGGGLAAPGDAIIPNARLTGTATYNTGTMLWTYRYDLTNVLATDSYHLYIYESAGHRGLHHEANFTINPVGAGGVWGTENVAPGPGRPGFAPTVDHYYHAGTFAGFQNYFWTFTDPDGPAFVSWGLSSNGLGNYPIQGGASSVPVPIPAPASVALIASGFLVARRRRR